MGLLKKVLFTGLTILSSFTSINSLSYFSVNNQECKVRPQTVNVNSDAPVFFPFSVKKVNAVVVVIILMTHMRKYVFLML